MSCNLNIKRSSVTEELRSRIGSNNTLFTTYMTEVMESIEDNKFTEEFSVALKESKGIDVNNISENDIPVVVDYIREYYNRNHPDIHYSAINQNTSSSVGKFGYNSVADRDFCKKIAANFVLDVYRQIVYDKNTTVEKLIEEITKRTNKPITKKQYLMAAVIQKIKQEIRDRIVSKGIASKQDVENAFKKSNISQIEQWFGENPTIQDKNWLALLKEITVNRNGFFTEVYRNSNLGELRFDRSDVLAEDTAYDAIDSQLDETESSDNTDSDNSSSANDKNDSIRKLNEKLGDYANYMSHVNMEVKAYLGSLKKLSGVGMTEGEYFYDTNNALGIADTMDVNRCCTMLYAYGDFTNVATMIESIREIANSSSEFIAFHQLADYLEKNSDFCYKLYCTFGKTVMSKLETVVDGNNTKSRTSNRSATKSNSIRLEFMNAVRATSVFADSTNSKVIYNKLNDRLKRITEYQNALEAIEGDETMDVSDRLAIADEIDDIVNNTISELGNQLRRYYPTIEDSAISFYINNAHDGNKVENIKTLVKLLKSTIDNTYSTLQNYNSREAKINNCYYKLSKLKNKINNNENVSFAESNAVQKELEELYNTDYLDASTKKVAIELADELLNYHPIKIELNSRNVHGNLSSDVLNNSMITNLLHTLESKTALDNLAKYKSLSRQYDFSNIMIEHKDVNGNIINWGLFRRDEKTDTFVPTEYASELFQSTLFSGVADLSLYNSVVYSEMSKGDYVATAFINFFNVENEFDVKSKNNIKFANYFMRTPSDAPKNFSIKAPRYSVQSTNINTNNGLFIIKDKDKANQLIKEQIDAIKVLSYDDFYENYNHPKPVKRTLSKLISDATSKTIGNTIIPNIQAVNEKNPKLGDTVSVTFTYTTEDGIDNSYVLKGTLAKDADKIILEKPEFVGFAKKAHSSDVNNALNEFYRKKLIKSKDIEQSINIDHPIYKQFKNMFMQELTDAANAIDVLFKNKNGLVELDDDNNPIFNQGYANDEATSRKLYQNYHVGKGKTVLDNSKKGNKKLTGKVFESNKFIITKLEGKKLSNRNYGQEFIDEMITFLYGGADGTYLHTVRSEKGVNAVLTEAQEAVLNEKLEEFIKDYIDLTEDRLEEYTNFIPSNLFTTDNIAEFALNYRLMFANFDDVFEGNSKFYKSFQDFLKRAKEVQAAGVPYGLTDYNRDFTSPIKDIPSILDFANLASITSLGKSSPFEVKLRDRFIGVTIKNTIRTSEEVAVKGQNEAKDDGVLTKKLANTLHNDGLKKEDALEKAREMMSGFAETKVNDAQSYITFKEWIRRVTAKGEFNKYKSLIEAILDETKPVDAKTINEFIQVQKNFYYDHRYDSDLHMFGPRQIKNAEFVLVPRFIKGTSLELVHDLMDKYDIDQLNTEETSKAGKRNVLTLWDDTGTITSENLEDFEANVISAKEEYSYNYLYMQLDAPQHLDAENKAGIQIMKKILDNIDKDSPLYPIKEKFFKLYASNIKESCVNLMDELGVETDKNGNIVLVNTEKGDNIKGLNYEVLFKMFEEECMRLGLDSNMLDYVTLAEDSMFTIADGNTEPTAKMPSYFGNRSVKFENIAQSLFNNRITRQKLPGFHAAQITNVGFDTKNERIEYRLTSAGEGRGLAKTITPEEYKKLAPKNKMYYQKAKGDIVASKELKYHPVQYKNRNNKDVISWRDYEALSDEKKKSYEKTDPASYAEVMLPVSSFGLQRTKPDGTHKTDEELLKELKDAKLDEIIGYRIPTEGKQSICIMKVVGFLDDALGSTIVVPDNWVSQTGSDFDIDSVYGITFGSKINKRTGKIERIKYKEEADEESYFNYIRHKLEHKLNTRISKENKQQLRDQVNEELTDDFNNRLDYEAELYHNLPDDIREKVKGFQKIKKTDNKRENYIKQNTSVVEGLTEYMNNNEVSGKLKTQLDLYIKCLNDINGFISNPSEQYNLYFTEGLEKIKEKKLSEVETLAKQEGLLSFEEFKNLNATERNSRKARNNELVQCMIDILSNDSSLEENLSRSNFEDVTDARDSIMNEAITELKNSRSCYDFLDQAEYQDDVMSGAKLKAFSVTRDTFCSICNTVKPLIHKNSQVSIIYREEDGYDIKILKENFNNVEEISKGVYKVTHDTLGWSKKNKNVVGKILTAYSSQTTAYILDAVKEGSIPNVNDFTFKVYKLFPDIGSDYTTATAFMMQDGISRIVEQYNSTKSVYTSNRKNPINEAIKSTIKDILKLNDISYNNKDSIDVLLNKLTEFTSEFNELFGLVEKEQQTLISRNQNNVNKLPISVSVLIDRIKQANKFEGDTKEAQTRRLLFDLGVILQYEKLSNLGDAVSNYARVCNPDKFGAKQSIFATEDIFRTIGDILDKQTQVLTVEDGRDLLNAIYPGISSDVDYYLQSVDNSSAYPSLHYFLKYSTAVSVIINRNLFKTEDPKFVSRLLDIKNALDGNNNRVSEKIYKDYKNYVLNYLYGQTDFVSKKLTYIPGEGIVSDINTDLQEERTRIFGYVRTPELRVPVIKEVNIDSTNPLKSTYEETNEFVDFTVEDINNPTQVEINQFATLSPAQKVFWIQQAFVESGIFKYLKVNLFDNRKGRNGSQSIDFIEDYNSIETVYEEFDKCFYNNNPLVVLAAADLIKYSFAVEGFRMRKNAVNKVIKNTSLMADVKDEGTGIVNQMNQAIGVGLSNSLVNTNLKENFIRSHSNIPQIASYNVKQISKGKWELSTWSDGVIVITKDINKNAFENVDTNFYYEDKSDVKVNNYIRLRFGKNNILYKVYDMGNAIFAHPINLLEEYENSKWSANEANNIYPEPEYYQAIKDELFNRQDAINEAVVTDVVTKHKEVKKSHLYHKTAKTNKLYVQPFDINEKSGVHTGGFEDVINKVSKHFEEKISGRLYLRSRALASHMPVNGSTSIQTINGKTYVIKKVDFSKYNKKYIKNKNEVKERDPQIQEIMEKAQNAMYNVNDAFLITPYVETTNSVQVKVTPNELKHSSVTEQLGVNSMNTMFARQQSENDVDARESLNLLRDKDIKANNASVKRNMTEVMRVSANYVEKATNKVLDSLKYFGQEEDGSYYSIADLKAIETIRNNEEERNRFLKTILDARAFVKNYRIINEIDVDSEDPEIKHSLSKIKESIYKLQNATIIKTAEENFVNDFLAKLSNNPLVQSDVISLLDGYHSAGAFDAWVNDLQETSSPLLQIITKEVMADIRAKEMSALKTAKEFRSRVEAIEKKAKEKGLTIDWKHIIDENGRFIQEYDDSLIDEIERLRNDISNAKIQFGEGSIEHIKAKFVYDKFKLNHTHQALVDEYYETKLKLEKRMIEVYPVIYSTYKQLEARRKNILTHARNGVLEDSLQEEYKNINKQMLELSSTYYYDSTTGTLIDKWSVNDPNNPFKGEDKSRNSIESAYALNEFLEDMRELRKKYFTHDAKYGFEEELEKRLDIINNAEKKDPNGNITVPITQLMQNEEYVEAKEWIEQNARFVVDDDIKEIINEAFRNLREEKEGRRLLKLIAKRDELYDSHGVIDATKIAEEDIRKLREEELRKYNISEGQAYSDRILISNAPTDDTVFSYAFYKGMTTEGAKNNLYIDKVNEINRLLEKYYNTSTQTVETWEMSIDELKELERLYDELDDIKKVKSPENKKAVKAFIEKNVDFVYDWDKYNAAKKLANQKGGNYARIWNRVNASIAEIDGVDQLVPNRYLYGYAVPKGYPNGQYNNDFIDHKKTDALRLLSGYTTTVETEYYYKKFREMQSQGTVAFNKWYYENHVYNPYTHSYKPLDCWTRLSVKTVADDGSFVENGMYIPAFNQMNVRPKNGTALGEEDYTNHKFKENSSTASNYKKEGYRSEFSDNADYNNSIVLNEAEREMKDLFESTLRANAKTSSAKKFSDKGYMAARPKGQKLDAKFYVKEAAKLIGWINNNTGRENWYPDADIDYARDTVIDMPLMSMLKSKDSVKINYSRPNRDDYSSDEEYDKAIKEFEDKKKEDEKTNAEVHKNLLDDDWVSVMEEFITKAAHFNAIQDNKYMLFFAKNMLDRIDVYIKNEGFNDFQHTFSKASQSEVYTTKKDTRLEDQFANWIRRLVYDQWKKPNNGLTRAANIMQSLTSAKFMMLNITGGIANVTLGQNQIFGEMFAKDYFGADTWAKGIATWNKGVPSFLADMNKPEASSLPSAIVRFFGIVDFDEHTGVVHVPNAAERIKRARDILFSPQAIGEHFMQNGALFSLLHSHRLIKNEDKELNGKTSYIFVNEAEYARDANEKTLQSILTEEQISLWKHFVANETFTPNNTKDYAWFRKDLTTQFANIYLNDNQKKEFITKRKEIQKSQKEEFNKLPTIYSQLKLKDGMLDFVESSVLYNLGDEAYKILGAFKGRAISVNKKIHGVYDRLGAAKIESQWWGGLVMQYHKHIYPGIMKRYRRQGYFNEERGTIEKGCYASIKDFLSLPLQKRAFAKKIKEDNSMSDGELEAVQGIQNLFKSYVNFIFNIKTNWQMLPEYERGNIKRSLGDVVGTLSALCLAVALRAADDDEEGLIYNLFMYEADRLASESMMFNPLGLYAEGEKLWSSPVAANGFIDDCITSIGLISQYIIQGDEFDPYYNTGLYKGEHKLWVNIRRNIPVYHSINMIERLERSNKYYKLGDNMLSIVPVKDIADWIND